MWSRLSARTQELILWIILGSLSLAAGLGGAYVYSNFFNPKQVTYRVCLGSEAKLCPKDTVFVQNIGPQPIVDWVGVQCAKFKRQQTIASEGPKDCDCSIVQVTCATTF